MTVILTTDRLVLRGFTADDVDRLTQLDADPAVMRHLTGGIATPRAVVEREVLPRLLGYQERHGAPLGYAAAEERAGGAFVGWFEFRPVDEDRPLDEVELGYRLHRRAWGRGYATEGARALLRLGFEELGVRRVTATTMAVNTRSRRVLEKAGLRHVRTFHPDWPDPIEGSEHGEVEYALEAADRPRASARSDGASGILGA
ncbi:GNAT family N-acetyltransferase [Kitasatospora sp. NPDC057015]|uniref:GNAT family N-acetyltransferase n=1 Tax=Kitasatospora sp. NPDC057015 TaxID=3346001 RepID=UPI00362F0C89